MDIIRTIIELSGDNILNHINNLILKSDNDIKNFSCNSVTNNNSNNNNNNNNNYSNNNINNNNN